MKHLDFTIDFETCALTANAAPMQVAVVPWRRYANDDPFVYDDTGQCTEEQTSSWPEPYVGYIDLRSCVVDNYDFDKDTIKWWNQQRQEAKDAVTEGLPEPITDIIKNVINYIRGIAEQYSLDSICLWSHGMDVDIAILRSICKRYEIDMEKTVKHTAVRDCRTVIIEVAQARMGRRALERPETAYGYFDSLPENYNTSVQHDALYDAVRSSWYTWQALKLL